MHPRVSVIIPCYNYGRYVGDAVESVLRQTLPPYELIVVNNGSTDDTRERLLSIRDPRVKVVHQENQGQAGARNSGLRIAGGDFIAFLDADDIWLPGKLEKQLPLFARPEVGLVYCGMRSVGPGLEPLDVPELPPCSRGRALRDFACGVYAPVFGGESTAVARAGLLREAGEFERSLSIGTGWDMWRRIASRSELDFVPEALVLYRQHGTNLSKRLDIYAHDTELKLRRMFTDPASREVWPLRRRALGVHRLSLAASFWKGGDPLGAMGWALRALLSHPPLAVKALLWPFRRLRGRGEGAH